jgi:hypothetical protein
MMRTWLSMLVALGVCSSASAQNVLAVSMQGQPLIYSDAGNTTGCGVRIVGVVDPVPGQRDFRSFDISANMYARGVAVGKAIGEMRSTSSPISAGARRQPLYGAWWKRDGDEPFAPVGKSFAASAGDKGAYLFQSTLTSSFDFVLAVIKGHEIQVGLRWQSDKEAIYTGTVGLTDDERRQIASCVSQTFK